MEKLSHLSKVTQWANSKTRSSWVQLHSPFINYPAKLHSFSTPPIDLCVPRKGWNPKSGNLKRYWKSYQVRANTHFSKCCLDWEKLGITALLRPSRAKNITGLLNCPGSILCSSVRFYSSPHLPLSVLKCNPIKTFSTWGKDIFKVENTIYMHKNYCLLSLLTLQMLPFSIKRIVKFLYSQARIIILLELLDLQF